MSFGNGKDIADPAEINFDASADYKISYSHSGVYREKTVPVGRFVSPLVAWAAKALQGEPLEL